MSNRDVNNVRADAIADQVIAHVRDGAEIPGGLDVVAAAVRVSPQSLPDGLSQETKDAIRSVQECWSDELGIDMVE